jgi:putative PIN family toxin of toxin-antitoxin system
VQAVLDTNILVSGLLWHGPPHRLIEHVRDGTLTLITSPALLAEFADVVNRPKLRPILTTAGITRDRLLAELRQLAEIVDPPPLPAPVCRDPDDDAVLALAVAVAVAVAVAAGAGCIVSGDADLLALGAYVDIPIIDVFTAATELDS